MEYITGCKVPQLSWRGLPGEFWYWVWGKNLLGQRRMNKGVESKSVKPWRGGWGSRVAQGVGLQSRVSSSLTDTLGVIQNTLRKTCMYHMPCHSFYWLRYFYNLESTKKWVNKKSNLLPTGNCGFWSNVFYGETVNDRWDNVSLWRLLKAIQGSKCTGWVEEMVLEAF